MYRCGETCYYIENNTRVRKCIVASIHSGQVTIKISDSGAICLPESRLYRTLEEAARMLPEVSEDNTAPTIHPPQLH